MPDDRQPLFEGPELPARWGSGPPGADLAWLHVVSDVLIFGACLAIPLFLVVLIRRRPDLPFPRVLWLVGAFLLACGATHLNQAQIFWNPYSHFAGVLKLVAAGLSWITVFALLPAISTALKLKTPAQLEAEVEAASKAVRAEERRTRDTVLTASREVRDEALVRLRRSNLELEHFAHLASHDLREPLRMVSNFVGLLAEEYHGRLSAEADEYIRFARDGARRMDELLDGLLEYSRSGTADLRLEILDLDRVVADVLEDLQIAIADASATVDVGSLPRVRGDRAHLRRVLQNLLANALKFRGEAAPRIRVAAERIGAMWRLEVRDNGIGVDPDYAQQIFTLFRRLHGPDDFPGAGIGLAVCQRIIARHGGEMDVAPNPGGGAVLSFTLPALDRPAT